MTYPEWIRAHRQKFLDEEYTLPEVVNLSIAAGWTREEMAKTLRHWPRALWVTDVDASVTRLAKQQTSHLESTIKRMNGTCLDDQWHDLYSYLQYGKTWDDGKAA